MTPAPTSRLTPLDSFMPPVRAVSLDFYNTLVHTRGRRRGLRYMEYLSGQGLDAAPWRHAGPRSPSASSELRKHRGASPLTGV